MLRGTPRHSNSDGTYTESGMLAPGTPTVLLAGKDVGFEIKDREYVNASRADQEAAGAEVYSQTFWGK